MSFINVRKIPSPEEIKDLTPLAANLQKIKAERDAEIKDIFAGNSDKFIVIIGPCSADDETSVCDYILPFSASLQKNNFFATQFHPEKSGKFGNQILKNFLKI